MSTRGGVRNFALRPSNATSIGVSLRMVIMFLFAWPDIPPAALPRHFFCSKRDACATGAPFDVPNVCMYVG